MSESREIELKFELDPGSADGFPQRISSAIGAPAESARRLSSTYFDTPKRALRRRGLSLRLREDGERRIQTLKASSGSGIFDRSEWESETSADRPDPTRFTEARPRKILRGRDSLDPVFVTEVERTTWSVQEGASAIEVALDRGTVRADGAASPLDEVELELKQGSPHDLFGVARRLAEAGPLRIGVRSKSERGYALLDGMPERAVKAEPVELSRTMSAAEAFQAIARSCLRQFRLNEPLLVGKRDVDALHQARVAMRRLRSALSVFRDAVADSQLDSIRRELKELSVLLGEARNLDVYRAQVLAPEEQRRPDEPGLAEYGARVGGEREAAYDRVLGMLASDRFRLFTVELAGWIEAGPWLSLGGAGGRDQDVWSLAVAELTRRRRSVKRKGRRLDEIEPAERHQVRIAAKKLRYASEFFASLVVGAKNRDRHRAFVTALEHLQECLGELNDIRSGQETAERIAAAVGQSPDLAFAAGHVTGEQDERETALLHAAMAAHAQFRSSKPFWR